MGFASHLRKQKWYSHHSWVVLSKKPFPIVQHCSIFSAICVGGHNNAARPRISDAEFVLKRRSPSSTLKLEELPLTHGCTYAGTLPCPRVCCAGNSGLGCDDWIKVLLAKKSDSKPFQHTTGCNVQGDRRKPCRDQRRKICKSKE